MNGISDRASSSGARGSMRTTFAFVLAAVTVGLSAIGWWPLLEFQGIDALGEWVARIAKSFLPDVKLFDPAEPGNVLTRIAAITGMMTTFLGVIFIAKTRVQTAISSTWTSMFRSGHAVIIGQTEMAATLAEGLRGSGTHVVQIVTRDPATDADAPWQCVSPGTNTSSVVAASGLLRASTLIIDAGGDAETIAVSKPLLDHIDREKLHKLASVALRVEDPVIADAFADAFTKARGGAKGMKLPRPVLFDENQALASYTLRRWPLYDVARKRKQKRIHALIIGFGDLGEKLLDEIMLTSVAGAFGPPRITALDRNAGQREKAFRARRPAVLDTLDISILPLDLGCDPMEGDTAASGFVRAMELSEKEPVTAIYLALPTMADTLRAIMLLQQHHQRTGNLRAPIFYRSRIESDDGDLLASHWRSDSPDTGCTPLRLPIDDLLAAVTDPERQHAVARLLHEDYVATSGATGPVAVPWAELSETYRRANIRAAAHIPAKLETLGIRMEPGAGIDSLTRADLSRLREVRAAGPEDPRIQHLARIEHERWMIERKLTGWQYGTPRNNDRLIHPLLMPWEQLKKSPAEAAKDVAQVLAAMDHLLTRLD